MERNSEEGHFSLVDSILFRYWEPNLIDRMEQIMEITFDKIGFLRLEQRELL